MSKLFILPLVCLVGCLSLPQSTIRFDGSRNDHRMYRVGCQTSLATCREETISLVTSKCGSPNWMVALSSEAYGTSQYWVECL